MRQAILERPDAIVLAAADYNLLVPAAREVKRQGIPLVCIDSFVNSDDADARIGTDSYEGGQKCAAALMRCVKEGDLVAVMSYVKGSSTAIDRESGTRDYLDGKVRILETLYSNADADLAYSQAARLISETPRLRGIVALNDPTARGAARALDESGKASSIALIGFDNSLLVIRFVERGVISDTVVQKPFNMGYLGIKTALDLVQGRKPPRSSTPARSISPTPTCSSRRTRSCCFPSLRGHSRPDPVCRATGMRQAAQRLLGNSFAWNNSRGLCSQSAKGTSFTAPCMTGMALRKISSDSQIDVATIRCPSFSNQAVASISPGAPRSAAPRPPIAVSRFCACSCLG